MYNERKDRVKLLATKMQKDTITQTHTTLSPDPQPRNHNHDNNEQQRTAITDPPDTHNIL